MLCVKPEKGGLDQYPSLIQQTVEDLLCAGCWECRDKWGDKGVDSDKHRS